MTPATVEDAYSMLLEAVAIDDPVIFCEHKYLYYHLKADSLPKEAMPANKARIAREGTDVVPIGPARYNELYKKFGNLNSLLGWGHARVIENLLSRKPDCPRSLSDKFADARVIENALLRHGRKILIEQRPRAESDIAVAAASILAREAFIDWLERKGKELGVKLGRGVSNEIKSTAAAIVEKHGPQALSQVGKIHFRTAHEVAPDAFPAPPPKRAWVR